MELLKAGVQIEKNTTLDTDMKKKILGMHIDRSNRKISATARAFSFFFLMLCREKLIEGSALLCTGEKSKYHELFYDIHKCFSGADL